MSAYEPHPVVPVPAAMVASMRGRRVIVGVPGVGFRSEQRADNPVVQGGRTFVPVLSEQDYYRAELEQIEVFAALVPIDRVWVEEAQPSSHVPATPALDAPGVRWPIPVKDAGRVLDLRLVQAVADGHVRDIRAISDVYIDAIGSLTVRTCIESEWYAWALAGTTPTPMVVPAKTLWVE
jgi:hypothetical protein